MENSKSVENRPTSAGPGIEAGDWLTDFHEAWEHYQPASSACSEFERVEIPSDANGKAARAGMKNSCTNSCTRIPAIDAGLGGVQELASNF